MKKILIIFVMFSMFSCQKVDDLLNKKPYDRYEDDFILTTEEGMELLLTGIYNIMAGQNYYGALLYLYEAAKGPDFFGRNVTGGHSLYNEFRYSSSSRTTGNAQSLWQTIYLAIRNATLLIENIDHVKGNIEKLTRIKGEAYLLRGLCYFDLMRLFAYPPIFSIPEHSLYQDQFMWGAAILNTVKMGSDALNQEIRRETAEVTYRYIVEQFQNAEHLLVGRNVVRGRANAATAKALLIRTYLYLENWNKVIEEGEAWVERYASHYGMIPYESYTSTYYMPFNTESVWEFSYSVSDNLSTNSLNYWVRNPTYNEPGSVRDGKVSQNVGFAKMGLTWGGLNRGYDFLMASPNDVRRFLICEMGLEARPEYRTVRKYVGEPYHHIHNIPVVRLPEVYLSIAEAYANVANYSKAGEYLSLVSQPRRKFSTNSADAGGILDERRRELILEGHTYWDFFRTARNMSGRQIVELVQNATITFGNITGANYRTVYPIPLPELNANRAMRNQQNPGYAAWRPEFGDDPDGVDD
jgi:hypothetical protein